jgi:hypothetical protein
MNSIKIVFSKLRMGVIIALFASISVVLSDQPSDKSNYHLFRPTPDHLLRDLSTDRPDLTESPYTVDAGHFQVETDFVNATFDRDKTGGGDVRSRSETYGGINFKIGLLNQVDLQTVFNVHVVETSKDRITGIKTRERGVGDLTTRLKINLWGNDEGRTAFGMMPFVKYPLSGSGIRNGKTEGGLILPFAMDVGGGWGLGAQTEVDFVSDGAGGHDAEYFNTVTIGHDIIGNLAGYTEFAALVTPENPIGWQGLWNVGFTYTINANTQLDCGCNFGVTDSAPDYNPFFGVSFRY